MRKKIIIRLNKKYKEDWLVDLISSILKDLYYKKIYFFLDDVLIEPNSYHFILSGSFENKNVLINRINNYVKIQDLELVV